MINPSWLICKGKVLKVSNRQPVRGIQVVPTGYLGAQPMSSALVPRPPHAPAQHVPSHAQPVLKPSHRPKVVQPRKVVPRGSVAAFLRAAASSSAAQPPRVIPARIIKVEEKARPRPPRQPSYALVMVGHRKPKHNMSRIS
jgi:hypothetical protein